MDFIFLFCRKIERGNIWESFVRMFSHIFRNISKYKNVYAKFLSMDEKYNMKSIYNRLDAACNLATALYIFKRDKFKSIDKQPVKL